MSTITEITSKFKHLDTMFVPIIVANFLALAFSLPGIIKLSEMILGPNKRDFYSLNDDAKIQCIRSDSGLYVPGNWFEWLRTSIILSGIISILNVVAVLVAGTNKPGESDSTYGKISILCNVTNITFIILIYIILFNSVEVKSQVSDTDVVVEPVESEVATETVEGYQQINGDYCFARLFKSQKLSLKIFLGFWIGLYALGIVFTLLAIRPISGSEISRLAQSRQRSAQTQMFI